VSRTWTCPSKCCTWRDEERKKKGVTMERRRNAAHDVMRTSLAWIQPHTHGAMQRYILNMVNTFLCSSTNYLENRLPPNDLIIVRNYRDDEEGIRDTKDVLLNPRNVHAKVDIQSNLEFQNVTLSLNQSPGPPCLEIDAQDAFELRFGYSTSAWKKGEVYFPNKIGFNQNCQNKFNIHSPSHP
jgi:hypothetical protein